jgi:hypothetical protein
LGILPLSFSILKGEKCYFPKSFVEEMDSEERRLESVKSKKG